MLGDPVEPPTGAGPVGLGGASPCGSLGLVDLVVPRREQHEGHAVARLAQPPAQREPVEARHVDVAHDRVGAIGPDALEPARAVGRGEDLVACVLERDRERVEERGVVVDEKDP